MQRPRLSALPLVALVAALLGDAACGPSADARYNSPALTYRTYARAVAAGDAEAAWACFSPSYQSLQYDLDPGRWRAEFKRRWAELKRAEERREIAEERVLNERLAFLLFDAATMTSDKESPFVYFLRDSQGWKMTTHLDTVFHRELERAIARGEYRLPRRD